MNQQEPAYLDEKLSFEERAKDLVSLMTIDEAASQLRYDAPAIPRLNVPDYNWWNEALHGVARCGMATVFPQAIALGAAFNPDLVGEVADAISTEGRAKYNAFRQEKDHGIYKGITYWSPNVNIFRDPRWGRGQETYGEDPYLSARLGTAYVKGLQGNHPRYLKAAACAKHFAVHSGPESLRHSFNAVAAPRDLEETYLPAFEALAKAGVAGFMGAYNRTNGEPCCAGKQLMMDTLRGKWGWDGYFTSDCWAIADFHLHHNITSTAPESAALALKHGCHLNCGNTYLHMLLALQEGLVTQEDIRRAAVKLMEVRMRLGMFDLHTPWDKLDYSAVDSPEHRRLNLRSARESLVLLKNDGILPLDPETISTVAVIGPNADSQAALNGNYHGTANEYTTVLEGVRQALPDKRVIYTKGCHLFEEKLEDPGYFGDCLSEAKIQAKCADLTILVLGMDETIEGEEMHGRENFTGDKRNLLLPASQRALMEAVLDAGKPCIVVCMTGSAVDLSMPQEKANAVIQAWYPGARGGTAVADLLLGAFSPSGRLPVTFCRNDDPIPDFEDYSMENRTYKYIHYEPLYPFGFGLSYTSFSYGKLEAAKDEGGILLTFTLANKGEMDAMESVQAYVEGISGCVRRLAAIDKVFLCAGEAREISLRLDWHELCTVTPDGERVHPQGSLRVTVGGSQPDTRSLALGATPCCCIDIEV